MDDDPMRPGSSRGSQTGSRPKGNQVSDKPATVAVATYADKASAEQDYDVIRGTKHAGQIDHLATVPS
jgi:hypothetical protein